MVETPIKTKITEADLAIKIVSPFEKAGELLTKIRKYFSYGTQEVWVLYSTQRELHQHIVGQTEIRIFSAEDTFTSTLFPGLSIRIADLFLIPEAD